MIAGNVVAYLKKIAENDGIDIQSIDIAEFNDGWKINFKADGNPFEGGLLKEGIPQIFVPLRGRECQYHSAFFSSDDCPQSEDVDIPYGWKIVWHSTVAAWDEYTDSPDKHLVEAWMGPPSGLAKAEALIRSKFEANLVGELAGDLYLAGTKLEYLTQPITNHEKQAVIDHLSKIMRTITCL